VYIHHMGDITSVARVVRYKGGRVKSATFAADGSCISGAHSVDIIRDLKGFQPKAAEKKSVVVSGYASATHGVRTAAPAARASGPASPKPTITAGEAANTADLDDLDDLIGDEEHESLLDGPSDAEIDALESDLDTAS
jgi:hypothetical protein